MIQSLHLIRDVQERALGRQGKITSPELQRSPQGRGHWNTPMLSSPLRNVLVIKISGKLCEPENLAFLAQELKQITERGYKVILVHGGQKQIDQALAGAGIATVKKQGKRITPPQAIPLIASTLSQLNGHIGRTLGESGISTVCINGKEMGVVKAKSLDGFERTGRVESVDARILEVVLRRSDVVVLSCLAYDTEGHLNVNADDVARAMGEAVKASKLILLSDVPGVLRDPSDRASVIPKVNSEMAHALIEEGITHGGMAEKVMQCSAAAAKGVEVILADGNATPSLVGLIEGREVCTRFLAAA